MRSKLLYLRVQGFLVDEDDDGEVIATVELEPVQIARRDLPAHLRSIDQLCAARTTELEAAKPNRATRRATRQPRQGGKR